MLITKEMTEQLQDLIVAPYVAVRYSALGGADKASLLITVSLHKREDWPNTYIENSTYAKFHLHYDWKLEHYSGYGMTSLRKSKIKSIEHAAEKINAFIKSNEQK